MDEGSLHDLRLLGRGSRADSLTGGMIVRVRSFGRSVGGICTGSITVRTIVDGAPRPCRRRGRRSGLHWFTGRLTGGGENWEIPDLGRSICSGGKVSSGRRIGDTTHVGRANKGASGEMTNALRSEGGEERRGEGRRAEGKEGGDPTEMREEGREREGGNRRGTPGR